MSLRDYTMGVAALVKALPNTTGFPMENACIGAVLPEGTLITNVAFSGFYDSADEGSVEVAAASLSERIAELGLNRFASPPEPNNAYSRFALSPDGIYVRGIIQEDLLGRIVYRFDVLGGIWVRPESPKLCEKSR